MLKPQQVVRAMAANTGIKTDVTRAQQKLQNINQNAMFEERRAKSTVRVWDGKTPFNGASLDYIKSKVPEGGFAVQTIENGVVVGFDWFGPETTHEAGLARIQEQIDAATWTNVEAEVAAEVEAEIIAEVAVEEAAQAVRAEELQLDTIQGLAALIDGSGSEKLHATLVMHGRESLDDVPLAMRASVSSAVMARAALEEQKVAEVILGKDGLTEA